MLPFQAQDAYNFHIHRGRRLAILIGSVIVFMAVLSSIQDDDHSPNEPQVEVSKCENLKINPFDLVINNTHYDDPLQQACAQFLLGQELAQHYYYYQGRWDDGTFIMQLQRSIDKTTHRIIISMFMFKGEYFDDPRTALQVSLPDAVRTGITFNNHTFQMIDQEARFTDSTHSKQCRVSLSIQLLNDTEIIRDQPLYSQVHMNMEVDATRCQGGLQFKATAELRKQDIERKSYMYSCLISSIAFIQIVCTLRMLKQIFESNSQAEHYSLLSLGIASSQDAYMSILHIYIALSMESLFHQFITPALLYFLLFSVFEMRLLITTWKLRQNYFVENRQFREALMKFYLAYYIFMFVMSYLIYQYAMKWWFICLMSLWLLPQIIHNAIKGHPHRMDRPYTFGLMASRLFIILYAKGCPHNLFELRPNYELCLAVTLITAVQILVYYLQEQRGPRFFVHKIFLPKKFDYFVEIPDNIEFGGITNEVQALFNEDCSVCMNPLHQAPTLKLTEEETNNIYLNQIIREGNGKIMRTPCDHKFHTLCLAKWMTIKMTCPGCRSTLPVI